MKEAYGLNLHRLEALLAHCVVSGASDLHLSVNCPPTLRLHGKLRPLDEHPMTSEEMILMVKSVVNNAQYALFETQRSLDIAYSLSSGDRFRINAYYERGHTALAIRRLDTTFHTLKDLGLPASLEDLTRLHHGLVLVTGPTGSGKSTTLAAMLHLINLSRDCHILTIEDPIETIHRNYLSMVHQRELHTDVPDFASAVRAAMREDPDVILVGEMRDLETMRAALMAAETGHLVFSTLHTGDAVGVLERFVGGFPGNEQEAVRQQLSMVLRAVVAQHLVPTKDGKGRVPVVEILMGTPAVAHLIRNGKSQQLVSAMESGQAQGMQTLDAALAEVVRRRLVDAEPARRMARDPKLFDELLHRPQAAASSGDFLNR